MIPVVTPEEMRAIDAAAPEPVDVLIGRAGFAVARAAVERLGGTYGRRIVVVAGPGNNGRDGMVAAALLRRRGAAVTVIGADDAGRLPACDLVIDAAFGTGFRGSFSASPTDAPVLAVDIASGVDGTTGVSSGTPYTADATVTFAALKPGLLLADGPPSSGRITLVDVGLDVSGARIHLAEASDLERWVPARSSSAHKWRSAVWVIGGSPGMGGAPSLSGHGAFAAGASYVRLSVPGASPPPTAPPEAVATPLPLVGWDVAVASGSDRIAAIVVGPGLGRSEAVRDAVTALVGSSHLPMVVDGDGLWALAGGRGRLADAPRVLTPHDGEYAQLAGHPVPADRIAAARELAAERRSIVLLKGPTTVVADPSGRVRLIDSGDQRLATAGTGDVLSGVIGALLARGSEPFDAATAGAYVHGWAARSGLLVGMVASDLPPLVSAALSGRLPPPDRVRVGVPLGGSS